MRSTFSHTLFALIVHNVHLFPLFVCETEGDHAYCESQNCQRDGHLRPTLQCNARKRSVAIFGVLIIYNISTKEGLKYS